LNEFTRPATWEDVKRLAGLLNEAGVEYALVGGYAIAAHGFNRLTEDIDILVNPSVENARRWIVALAELPDGAAKELLNEPDIFSSDTRYALRINDEITVDVMPSIAGHGWHEMKEYIVENQIDGVRVALLNLEGLLKTKQGLRLKDQADAAMISAALDALSTHQTKGSKA